MSFITNLGKGIIRKFSGKSIPSPHQQISWTQEKWLKHLPINEQVHSIQMNGQQINFTNPLDVLHTYTEIFIDEIYKFSGSSQKPFVLDCGAHIGMGSLYFKLIYPEAVIHAFEPDPNNFQLLTQNISGNHLKNITLHNEAVWINNGSISFAAKGSQASSIVAGDASAGKIMTVKCVRLKELLQNRKVDFLKLDIEGAEYEVVKDCAEELVNVDHFFLEYHGKVDDTRKLNDLLEILNTAGFLVYIKNAADELRTPFFLKRIPNYPYEVQLNIFAYRK